MSEEQAFLSAIAANPADATVRLVFADWLTERDDLRGEWLRVRTQLALLGPDNEGFTRLEVRERELAPLALVRWMATEAPIWALLGGGLPHPPLPDSVAEENVRTWEEMVEFYTNFPPQHWGFLSALREFVASIAHTETAKLFRAGQSLVTLVLSTIERHGLALEDASAWVQPASRIPRFQLGYRPPNEGKLVEVECDDLSALRGLFGKFLTHLWCDTRGCRNFARDADH